MISLTDKHTNTRLKIHDLFNIINKNKYDDDSFNIRYVQTKNEDDSNEICRNPDAYFYNHDLKGVKDGTIVRVESEVARQNLPVKISEWLENDVVFVYKNFSASPVNTLQMRKRKVDRVKITVVEGT